MILARVGNQLLTVHADHHDLKRHAELWVLLGRFKELHYSASLEAIHELLAYLGLSPNLKVFRLRPLQSYLQAMGGLEPIYNLPTIFPGCFPSLRHLSLPNSLVWPDGAFRGLTSFEYGTLEHLTIYSDSLFDAIRGSPLIESLRVVGRGCCLPNQGSDTPPFVAQGMHAAWEGNRVPDSIHRHPRHRVRLSWQTMQHGLDHLPIIQRGFRRAGASHPWRCIGRFVLYR